MRLIRMIVLIRASFRLDESSEDGMNQQGSSYACEGAEDRD